MRKGKSLYGIISNNGELFTVYYENKNGHINHNVQGYSKEIFKTERKTLPIIRYDKVDLNLILSHSFRETVLKRNEYILEHDIPVPFLNIINPITVKTYLNRLKSCGVPIELNLEV